MLAHERWLIEVRDVVEQDARVLAGRRGISAVLPRRALQNDCKCPAVRRQCHALEALIVLPAEFRIGRLRRLRARTGIVGRKILLAVAARNERIRRPDHRKHAARTREAIDVWSVLIADEKASVARVRDGLRIKTDPPVDRLWHVRETIAAAPDADRIEAAQLAAHGVGQHDRIEQ